MKLLSYAPLLPAIFLALIALNWIFNPEAAASSLGLIISDPVEKNTLIRDFTAFFLRTSIMSVLSFLTKQYQWIFSAGLFFLIAGIFNVLTSINYETEIAVASLISELIFTLMAFTAAYIYKSN